MAKDEYIGFRTTSKVKEVLQRLSDKTYRTVSQQCEMIITEYLKREGHLSEDYFPETSKKPKK